MKALSATTLTGHLYRVLAGAALLATLGACGFKGPLYLPPPPAVDAKLAAPPTPQPLPQGDTSAAPSPDAAGATAPATTQ
jgi:predicted small lipoprotein YifL